MPATHKSCDNNTRHNEHHTQRVLFGTITIVILFALISACTAKHTPEKVVVQTGWILNGEISPECSAIVNGYYKDEGLEVELRPGGPSGSSFLISTLLLAQDPEIDIAIDNDVVTLIQGRAQENPLRVKMFAAFWQDSPAGFLVRADSSLYNLKDLAGRKPDGAKYVIGATAGPLILEPLANYLGVPVSDLNVVQTGFDASPFLSGQVDALFSFWTGQAYQAETAGIPYRFLLASEIPGLSQPAFAALATEETLRDRPEMLEKWLRATIRGAHYNIKNPEESARQILDSRCGGSTLDIKQEAWLINKSLPLYQFDKSYDLIGNINKAQIMGFAQAYYDYKQISHVPREEELMDFSILNRIYGPK